LRALQRPVAAARLSWMKTGELRAIPVFRGFMLLLQTRQRGIV
jgi:hypothetical protein